MSKYKDFVAKIKCTDDFKNSLAEKMRAEELKVKEKNVANEEKNKKNTVFKNVEESESKIIKKLRGKYAKRRMILSLASMFLIVFICGTIFDTGLLDKLLNKQTTVAVISSIEPTKYLSYGVIDNESEFIIKVSNSGETEESVAKSVYVEPAVDYTIEKTGDKEFKLKFKQNIPDSTIVKLQYVKNKIVENSWAYQTQNKLSVSYAYPTGNSVSTSSAIEIVFSKSNVENLEDYVEIYPETKGTWTHEDNRWLFESNGLVDNKNYTVTVKKGLKAGDEVLEEDYVFTFFTSQSYGEEGYVNVLNASLGNINSVKENESPFFNLEIRKVNLFDKIQVNKFSNADEFIEYVNTNDYSKSKMFGEYDFTKIENDNIFQVTINSTFKEGYYVVIIKDEYGNVKCNLPLQVNNLVVSSISTERDLLVWVADANSVKENVEVEYKGKTQKTGKDGYTIFEEILDGSETFDYVKVGNGTNKFVMVAYNFDHDNYPYSYVYTDKPIYKNTDTVNIWGYVPLKFFYDEVDFNKFKLTVAGNEVEGFKINEDGSFTFKYELESYVDSNIRIELTYNDCFLGCRYINIYNYALENYTYNIIRDKNYAMADEIYSFDVEVEHVTGIKVPNKTLVVKLGDNVYKSKTDRNGIAHFDVNIKKYLAGVKDTYLRTTTSCTLDLYNGENYENTNNVEYISLLIIKNKAYIKSSYNKGIETFKIYNLNTKKANDVSYDFNEIYDGICNTTVRAKLIEKPSQKIVTGKKYNEYTKEYVDDYYYQKLPETIVQELEIPTNGKEFTIDLNSLNTKEDVENITYYYEMEFYFTDIDGKEASFEIYVSSRSSSNYDTTDNDDYKSYEYNSLDSELFNLLETDYDRYRYHFGIGSFYNNYNIGDTVTLSLHKGSRNQEVANNGKILKAVFAEGINNVGVTTQNSIDYTFTKDDNPGCKITGLYYENGKFYRIPVYKYTINEEFNEINLKVSSDKKSYKPGDEVTINIKTKPNASVNISVVNEAIFNISEDQTDIVSTICNLKETPVYTYASSLLDNYVDLGGGGGGGGEEFRGNFKDTAYFESVYADANGNATVKFTLPDNVTSYRVTVHSSTKDAEVGVAKINVTSTLDFFIQSTEPRSIKKADDVVLNAVAMGNNSNDNVEFEFSIKELALSEKVTGKMNEYVSANFGKLDIGEYTARIKAVSGNLEDAMEYKITVTESALEVKNKKEVSISNNITITPQKNPVILEIYNKNMKKYLEYIDFIESTYNQRLDTQIAYNKVQEIKSKYYGEEYDKSAITASGLSTSGFLSQYGNENENIIFTALTSYYAKEYCNSYCLNSVNAFSNKNVNIIEAYLLASANNEPVLSDVLILKDETELSNHSKLLVTLSLEFLGDYQSAKELYDAIELNENEEKLYKDLTAIIETFIYKDKCVEKIDDLIKNKPTSNYLRYAILSYFENNSNDLENAETVTITGNNINETFTINGLQIVSYEILDKDVNSIKFETTCNDLIVSYSYESLIEEVDNVVKDIDMTIDGELKVGNVVNLKLHFNKLSTENGSTLKIALPNSLRFDKLLTSSERYDSGSGKYISNDYYLIENKLDYVKLYKRWSSSDIEIPLVVIEEGNYLIEGIAEYQDGGVLHTSNSLEINISK